MMESQGLPRGLLHHLTAAASAAFRRSWRCSMMVDPITMVEYAANPWHAVAISEIATSVFMTAPGREPTLAGGPARVVILLAQLSDLDGSGC